MTGRIIDNIYFSFRRKRSTPAEDIYFLDTDFGRIRVFDTKENKPVVINVPDGPNVIEHQLQLLKDLSRDYRVICFEYPGLGQSYPNRKFNYSFKAGSALLLQVMELLKIDRTSLLFSCSNGYYALQAASEQSDRFDHVFISQTPSISSIMNWRVQAIPDILNKPVIGQIANIKEDKKLARTWYQYALPKDSTMRESLTSIALDSLHKGGCFCLSSLVQGLAKDGESTLNVDHPNVTLLWGGSDYTHRHTDKNSIRDHVKDCEIIEFTECGHFPDLERTEMVVKLIREKLG